MIRRSRAARNQGWHTREHHRGGHGIAVQVDHTMPERVARLIEQVGEVDILVNDIWGGDDLVAWGK